MTDFNVDDKNVILSRVVSHSVDDSSGLTSQSSCVVEAQQDHQIVHVEVSASDDLHSMST